MGSSSPLTNGSFEYYEFPVGENRLQVFGQMEVPLLWVNGRVEFMLHYSGSTGSTNNIKWGILANSVEDAAALFTGTELSAEQDMAGPATANWLKRVKFTSTLLVKPEDKILGFKIYRNGPDETTPYAGTAYLLGVLPRFIPGVRQADTRGRS